VALITDARFSGVSTGACIGHVGPEALAGGPLGKVREGDRLRIVIDRARMEGSVDFVGDETATLTREQGADILAKRERNPALAPHASLPIDTVLWAALQSASGGTWGGCVYDAEAILAKLGSASLPQ
jgi:dihydroxyacid dehydratase/phosphogluconate dehydratase